MKISLKTKNQNRCFHLRGVQSIRLNLRGISRLEGIRFHDVYEKTHFRDKANVELEISQDNEIKAYYLCGISKKSGHIENVGVAFVPCSGHSFQLDTKELRIKVSGARNVHFQGYKSDELTNEPLSHVFAGYLSDGMPL